MELTKPELTARQIVAATMLAAGHRHMDICKHLDISGETMNQWQRKPAFRAKVEEEQIAVVENIRARLRGLADKSMQVIESLLDDVDVRPDIRLKAAALVLGKIEASDPRVIGASLHVPSPSAVRDFELAEQLIADHRRERAEAKAVA